MGKKFTIICMIIFSLGVIGTVLYFGYGCGELALLDSIGIIAVIIIGSALLLLMAPKKLSDSAGNYIFEAYRTFDVSIDYWDKKSCVDSVQGHRACLYLYKSILYTVRYLLRIKDIKFDADAPLFDIIVLLPEEIQDTDWYVAILTHRGDLDMWSKIDKVLDYRVNENSYEEMCDIQADKLHEFEED